jgi:hypothetical protein
MAEKTMSRRKMKTPLIQTWMSRAASDLGRGLVLFQGTEETSTLILRHALLEMLAQKFHLPLASLASSMAEKTMSRRKMKTPLIQTWMIPMTWLGIHLLFASSGQDAILQGALPLVLHPLDLVVCAKQTWMIPMTWLLMTTTRMNRRARSCFAHTTRSSG